MSAATMANDIVFYSWQSDLPNPTNRGFIEKALENAAKSIRNDDSIEVKPVIDRDTEGVPGSPDIVNTIFSKIEQSQVFVCDVSIISKCEEPRLTPNPNVLIELGYAIKALGWDRIILVQNINYGAIENLPFDLKKRRVVSYCVQSDSKPEAKEGQRKQLVSKLERAIRAILSSVEASSSEETTLRERCISLIRRDDKQGWRSLIEDNFYQIPNSLVDWKKQWEPKVYPELSAKPEKLEAVKDACVEATDICLPGFIPIFCAVEQGNIELWEHSINPARRLARLEEKLLGGMTLMSEIGLSLLSFLGGLGMAIAVKHHQLELIKRWASLKITPYSNYENREYHWIELRAINWPYALFTGDKKIPFGFPVEYYDAKPDLGEFFKDSAQLKNYLLMGNFILSLLEFSIFIRKSNDNMTRLLQNNSAERIHPTIRPVWGTMQGSDFVDQIERLFSDLDAILKFCGLTVNNVSSYKASFWPLWRAWKRICLGGLDDYGRLAHRKMNALVLPGEPTN